MSTVVEQRAEVLKVWSFDADLGRDVQQRVTFIRRELVDQCRSCGTQIIFFDQYVKGDGPIGHPPPRTLCWRCLAARFGVR